MLQGNLNELDLDFIKVWSNYILYGDIDYKALTILAEKGQINAVQSYYLLCRENNEKINEHFNHYSFSTADEIFALANKTRFENPEQMKEGMKLGVEIDNARSKLSDAREELGNIWWLSDEAVIYYSKETEKWEGVLRDLLKQLCEIPFLKFKLQAIRNYKQDFKNLNNPLSGERAYELAKNFPYYNQDEIYKETGRIKKMLVKELKKDPENIGLQFALAKNLTFFDWGEKEKAKAQKMLKKLANREYSQTLQDELNNDITK